MEERTVLVVNSIRSRVVPRQCTCGRIMVGATTPLARIAPPSTYVVYVPLDNGGRYCAKGRVGECERRAGGNVAP